MADVEIKRGYVVLSGNNIRFGIKITNISELAISDVEVILDYTESLFNLEEGRLQKLGNIPPSDTRTAEFVLKPLACVHNVNIEALISYRDPKWDKHVLTMHPKAVHCVCPFLNGKAMPRAEFLELSGTGHSAETGLNFKGVDVEWLVSFLIQTCKSRHYKVDNFSIDGGRMLYLASESIGEKAYYLLTALIKESKDDGGFIQVMLRAVSDKPYGLNGFLSETVADLRHVVSTVQSAQEIGIIKKEQVINIIDSVVQRTTFGGMGGEGGASVNIQDSVVQRTEFDAGEDRRVDEERLRREQEEQKRKEEQERLRIQREEEERKAREVAERERQEKERLWQEIKEKQRNKIEEQEEKKRQEELRKKQEEEKEVLRRQEAQKAEQERKARTERERIERERKEREERGRAAQKTAHRAQEIQRAREEHKRIAKKKSKTRTNIFMLVIVIGALLVGSAMFASSSSLITNFIDIEPPQASLRASEYQATSFVIEHLGGDEIDTTAAITKIMINGVRDKPTSGAFSDAGTGSMLSAGSHMTVSPTVNLKNGDEIILVDIGSAKSIAQFTVRNAEPDVATPAPSSNQKTYTNSIGMEFVLIPAGSFDMGSPSDEDGRDSDEGPVHRVNIQDGFYLGKYEVTREQWREVMGDDPSTSKDDRPVGLVSLNDVQEVINQKADKYHPVETISWIDAQDFIKKLNQKEGTDKYRLPSEAEWEYAARAGTTTRYSFGDSESRLGEYAWYDDNSGDKTHPVGQKKPNPWGLYDMHGNVWEWVQDWYHSDYKGAPTDGSAWESGDGSGRVFRGGGLGSWSNYARSCRSAHRSNSGPGFRRRSLGFRLLRAS